MTPNGDGEGLPALVADRLRALVVAEASGDDADDEESVLALIRSVPGNVSLDSMLTEIRKLLAVRAVGLPEGAVHRRRPARGRLLAGPGRGGVPVASA